MCHEPFQDGQRVKTIPGCEHIYHEKCCFQWLHVKLTCPNCNEHVDLDHQQETEQPETSHADYDHHKLHDFDIPEVRETIIDVLEVDHEE